MSKITTFFHEKENRIKGLLLLCFVFVFVLNLLAVYTADDYGYMINDGFLDIFNREYIQYFTWNGRSIAHIIARLFLAMPKIIFDIANSACYVYVNFMIYAHVKGDKKLDKPYLLALVMLISFVSIPFFGQTVLWVTGSCNYLWMIAIILTFLYYYRQGIDSSEEKPKFVWILILLLGIVAGWTNENTGGALILIIILFFIYQIIEKKKFQIWQITGFIGVVLGYLVLVLAPGNKFRIANITESTEVVTSGTFYRIIHSISSVVDVMAKNPGWLFLIIAFAVLLILSYKKGNHKTLFISAFYFVGGCAALVAMLLTPNQIYFDRTMFGATIFIIISICILVNELDINGKVFNKLIMSSIAVLVVLTIFNYSYAGLDLAYTRYQYTARENYVLNQKKEGNLNPVVATVDGEFITSYNPLLGLNDIDTKSTFWLNEYYATIHNIESVTGTSTWTWEKLYKDGNPKLMNIQNMDEYIETVKNDDNLILLVTCSSMDDLYRTTFSDSLKKLNIDIKDDTTNIIAMYHNGDNIIQTNTEGFEYYGMLDEKKIYLASYDDPTLSDILINDVDYTNDAEGIVFVVFDKTQYKVVDSVRWNTKQGVTKGLRTGE